MGREGDDETGTQAEIVAVGRHPPGLVVRTPAEVVSQVQEQVGKRPGKRSMETGVRMDNDSHPWIRGIVPHQFPIDTHADIIVNDVAKFRRDGTDRTVVHSLDEDRRPVVIPVQRRNTLVPLPQIDRLHLLPEHKLAGKQEQG